VTTPTTIHTPDGFIPQAPPGPPYLTLRDQFAMAALSGVLANPENDSFEHEAFAIEAYRYADAMMKARGE
jgi:hypothetical protein